jgi:glycosyltransferase involved in cell wall biosynthesis
MDRKLKIAYFLDNFYPQINGVVTSSINTIFELSKRDHEIFGFASYSCKNFNNMPDDYFPFNSYYQKGSAAFVYPDFTLTYPFSSKVEHQLKKFMPDIIHFHAPITMGYQAIRLGQKYGIPVVGTFHTFFAEPEYLNVIGKKESKFLYNFGWWYSNQFFNKCSAVVSPAKITAEILIKNRLDNEVHVIPNGVDIKKYSKFKFTDKTFNIPIKKNEDWILFIGRLSKEKCLDVLIKSMTIVMGKNKNARLLLIGDGPYKNDLINLIKKFKLENKIYFTGMIPNKDLLESGIIKKMKLFATSSTSENQPMTIIESMMFGLPIVGVDAKGVPEMIDNNGYIVRPNDYESMAECILKVLNNKNIHSAFSKKSLQMVKKYDIRITTDKMEKLYYDLVDK